MTWDARDGYVLLVDGVETWAFSGGAWTELHPSSSPSSRSQFSLAFDYADDVVLLYGGWGGGSYGTPPLSDTWEFAEGEWTELDSAPSPGPRDAYGLAYDPSLNQTILWGGNDVSTVTTTWGFANGIWTEIPTASTPPGRSALTLAWDANLRELIMFGGCASSPGNCYVTYGDTWGFNGTTWVDLQPASAPPPELGMVSTNRTSSAGGGIVLFATDGTTWTWDEGPATFPVYLTESGLPAGTRWWANASGAGSFTSATTGLDASVSNGTYQWSFASADKDFTAAGGETVDNGTPVWYDVAFEPVDFLVGFVASGLPSGTPWSVDLDGVTYSTSAAEEAVNLTNGTFAYSVGAPAGYVADPSWGTVNVHGANVSLPLVFSSAAPRCGASVNPSGAAVNFGYSLSLASEGCDYLYAAVNGGKNISAVSFVPNLAWPVLGSSYANYRGESAFTVVGQSPVPDANFTSLPGTLYPLIGGIAVSEEPLVGPTFSASNSTDLTGTFNLSTEATVVLVVTASNDYAPGVSEPFSVLLNSSNDVVDGILIASATFQAGEQTFQVTSTAWQSWGSLSAVLYVFPQLTVTFAESGLPNGTNWLASLDGTTASTTGSALSFAIGPGEYAFSIVPFVWTAAGSWYAPNLTSGDVSVAGTNVTVTIVFARQVSVPITFRESGLSPDHVWSVALGYPGDAEVRTGSGPSQVLQAPEGGLPYAVSSPGYVIASVSGPGVVNGSWLSVTGSLTVKVVFGGLAPLTFQEHGLRVGLAWTVTIAPAVRGGPQGQTVTTTNASVTFTVVSDPYRWSVAPSTTTYEALRGHGSVGVGTVAKLVKVGFFEVTAKVTFTEKGLPRHSEWGVTIEGGPSLNSTGSSIVLRLPNGTYDYTVTAVNSKYEASSPNGMLTVTAPSAVKERETFEDPEISPSPVALPMSPFAGPVALGRALLEVVPWGEGRGP
jgi:hypothetical protein